MKFNSNEIHSFENQSMNSIYSEMNNKFDEELNEVNSELIKELTPPKPIDFIRKISRDLVLMNQEVDKINSNGDELLKLIQELKLENDKLKKELKELKEKQESKIENNQQKQRKLKRIIIKDTVFIEENISKYACINKYSTPGEKEYVKELAKKDIFEINLDLEFKKIYNRCIQRAKHF